MRLPSRALPLKEDMVQSPAKDMVTRRWGIAATGVGMSRRNIKSANRNRKKLMGLSPLSCLLPYLP